MTTSPPQAPTGPRVTSAEMRDVARLRRSSTDRYVAGISGGLGRHFDVDPVLFRVLFVVTAILGVGLLAYLALWLVVPEEGRDRGIISLEDRGRTVAVTTIGAVTALALVLGNADGPNLDIIGSALVIGLVVWLVIRTRDSRAAAPVASSMPGEALAAAPPAYGDTAVAPVDYPTAPAAHAPAQTPPRLLPGYLPKAPNPKKRGPLLFGFTLAAMVLGLGVLGMIDTAGADISASAYPALALTISGLMLVLGAFYGRAGGVILLGLISLLGLGVTTAGERAVAETLSVAPVSAAQVRDSYHLDSGLVQVDLSQVADPEELAGRTIEVSTELGAVEVILPEGMTVLSTATIEGFGSVQILKESFEGADTHRFDRIEGTDGTSANQPKPVTLITSIGVGTIEVTR